MKYLDIGCGSRFHAVWTNIDVESESHGILSYDVTQGIPFQDESFDVVYHSHVLGHFQKYGWRDL